MISVARFARSLLSVYAAVGVNGVLGLLSVPIGLRFLGAEGYGLFSLYTLIVSYVLMADLGISKNLLALLSRRRNPDEQLENLRTAFGLYCSLCVAWLALIPLLLWLVPGVFFPVQAAHRTTLRWLTVLAIAEFVVGVPQSMAQTACLAKEQFGKYSRFTMISGALRNSILIAGSIAFRSPLGLAAAILSRKLIDLYLAYRIMGPVPRSVWQFRWPDRAALAMLGQSGALSVAQVLYSSLMAAGSYLVNAHFGLYWLGLYRVAFDLAGKVSVIVNGITLVLFPKLALAFGNTERRAAMSRIVRPALEASWTFCSTLGACAVVAAPWLLPRMGITQPEALTLFVLLAVGLSMNCHTLLTNELIQATGRYRSNILVSLGGLVTISAVFSALSHRIGPAAIGVSWIVAATGMCGIADSVILRYLRVAARTQVVSAMKKASVIAICSLALVPYIGLGLRSLPVCAAGALLVMFVRDGLALLRAAGCAGWQEAHTPLAGERVAAA